MQCFAIYVKYTCLGVKILWIKLNKANGEKTKKPKTMGLSVNHNFKLKYHPSGWE